MIYKGVSRSEVEQTIEGKGNFAQIDYLSRFLKKDLSIDVKKFVYLKLAEIYDKIKLFSDSARMYDSAAIISLTFADKIQNYVKETEQYIKAGDFNKADEAMKKAMSQGNSREKEEIYSKIKNFYRKTAEKYEEETKRNNASLVYEKLSEMKLNDLERFEVKNKLNELYEKLGKK